MADKNTNALNTLVRKKKRSRKQSFKDNTDYDADIFEDSIEIISSKGSTKVKKWDHSKSDVEVNDDAGKSMSILGNSKLHHNSKPTSFNCYEDVKCKPEKKRSIIEIANNKDVDKDLSGWEVYEFSNQMKTLADNENEFKESVESVVVTLNKQLSQDSDEELKKCLDILNSSVQRSAMISKQLSASNSTVLKWLDHKPRITKMLSKFSTVPHAK